MAKIDKLTRLAKEHLDTEEEIIAVVQGTFQAEMFGQETLRTGILVTTDRRVVLYCKKVSGYEMGVFLYSNISSNISSIELGKDWMGHRVAFFVSNNKMGMKWIKTGDVQKFIEYVKSRIEKKGQETTPPEPIVDIPDQIKKLAELKDQGILTEEEFELKKRNC